MERRVYQSPDLVVLCGGMEGHDALLVHLLREGVLPGGSVQAQYEDVVLDLHHATGRASNFSDTPPSADIRKRETLNRHM